MTIFSPICLRLAAACAAWGLWPAAMLADDCRQESGLWWHGTTAAEVAHCIDGGHLDVDQGNGGGNALHDAAAFASDWRVLGVLLLAGADFTKRDDDGVLPLDYASGNPDMRGTRIIPLLNEGRMSDPCITADLRPCRGSQSPFTVSP